MKVIIINCFDTYEHRVDLLCDFFRCHGSDVSVYTSDYRHFRKEKRNDNKVGFKYVDTIEYKKNISFARIYSHYKLAKDIFKQVENESVYLLWVLLPPNSFARHAYKYKMKHPDVKLVFDIIDMWPETMPVKRFDSFPLVGYWRDLRNKYLKYADYVVTECDLYQEAINKYAQSDKLSTIYLARTIKQFHPSKKQPVDKIVLCYLGSINNIIDTKEIANIIYTLKKKKAVILHIIGDGEKKDNLINDARIAGADVIDHGRIFDGVKKQRIFDSCHYGLNIMKENVFVGLTMKSMDYFEAGLPIINNIHGDTWEMVKKYKLGVNVDSIDSIEFPYHKQNNVRAFFVKEFGVDRFNEQLENVLMRLGINSIKKTVENTNRNPLISVIIPLYNNEKYIESCLRSVCKQTYDDLEVIVVDDGSTDDGARIVKELAKNDCRIRYIYQQNAGVSAARNRGVDRANGEYIMFVDSDDAVSKNCLKSLYTLLSRYKCDIAIGKFKFWNGQDWLSTDGRLEEKIQVIKDKEALGHSLSEHIDDKIYLSVCGKIYCRELLKKNKLAFPIDKSVGEDLLFNLDCFKYTTNLVLSENVVYFYRLTESDTSLHGKNDFARLDNAVDLYNRGMHSFGEIELADYGRKPLLKYYMRSCFYQFEKNRKITSKEIEYLSNDIAKCCRHVELNFDIEFLLYKLVCRYPYLALVWLTIMIRRTRNIVRK